MFLREVLVIQKSGHIDMIKQHVERIVKICLGVYQIRAILHALHLDKTEQGLEVLLFEFLVGKPSTY